MALIASVLAALSFMSASHSSPALASAATGSGGEFVATTGRVLDTRAASSVGIFSTPMSPSVWRSVQVTGALAGVPTSGAGAVQVTVTVLNFSHGTDSAFVSADLSTPKPALAVDYGYTSDTASNTSIVALGDSGKIQVETTSTADVALAEAMPERNRAMIVVQATCGLRIGELLALKVESVDYLRKTLRVQWQFAPQSKIRTDPKTSRSKRTLPLADVTISALVEHLAKFPPGEDGTLFVTRLGTPYRHDYFGSILFQKARIKAGLPEGTTLHALRHHYSSELIGAGESVVTVAERLGHTDATTVLKVYAHLLHGSEDGTRRAIDAAWSGAIARTQLSAAGEPGAF